MYTEEEVKEIAESSLNIAIRNWGHVGKQMILEKASFEGFASDSSINTNIPGHPYINIGDVPKVEEFIALVVDMRKSSDRLNNREIENISNIENGFQRIYYETSALLPALDKTISFFGGQVTEYLGDGLLALFKVDEQNKLNSLSSAYKAAKHCINETRVIVNTLLSTRFHGISPLDIGAGLSMSRAMVTTVGIGEKSHPKAIGTCVWEASKLSVGHNIISLSPSIEKGWPSSAGGSTKFIKNICPRVIKSFGEGSFRINE